MKYLLILFLFITPVYAHSWYDVSCCNDADCRPIKCDELVSYPGGFKYHNIYYALDQVRPSQDKDCHACFSGDNPDNPYIKGHCLYLPGIS